MWYSEPPAKNQILPPLLFPRYRSGEGSGGEATNNLRTTGCDEDGEKTVISLRTYISL